VIEIVVVGEDQGTIGEVESAAPRLLVVKDLFLAQTRQPWHDAVRGGAFHRDDCSGGGMARARAVSALLDVAEFARIPTTHGSL
jgi:hypothetical protein